MTLRSDLQLSQPLKNQCPMRGEMMRAPQGLKPDAPEGMAKLQPGGGPCSETSAHVGYSVLHAGGSRGREDDVCEVSGALTVWHQHMLLCSLPYPVSSRL